MPHQRILPWLILLTLAGAGCKQVPGRTAQQGVLDLRGQKWTLRGFILTGEWLFAPQHFSSPEPAAFNGKTTRLMMVPGGWNGNNPGQPALPADSYGTYFLRVLLDPAARPVSLYLPNIHSAYRLYVNGKLAAGVGQPGKNARESIPQLFPLAVELSETPAELFVVVQVSNFHHRNGGLWKAPVLMEGRTALTGWRIDLAASWGEFGLYIGMALLFLALYFSMRRQPELIYFSLLCLLTALRAVLTGQRSLVYLFPDLPFHINYALEYITFIATPSAMAGMFYFHFFSKRKLVFFIPLCLLQAASLLLLGIVLLTPARTYTEIFPLATGLMFANAALTLTIIVTRLWAKDRDARLLMPAFSVLVGAAINDFLHNRNVIETGYFATYALAVFLVFIGVALGLRVRKIALDKRRIEADYEARNMFFSTISHELRTPLNAIYGTLQLMQESVSDSGTQKQISAMRHGCDVLLALINDILDLARISAHSFTLRYSGVNLREMLGSLLQVFEGAAKNAGISLALHIEESVPEFVLTDEFRLKQILINLMGNALKFTRQGEIAIRCERVASYNPGADIVFSVTDTGIGIPEEEQKIIFDEFFQAKTAGAVHTGGTGLGLAIARRLVRFMGGDIFLESRPGQGSKFSFQLHFDLAAAPQSAASPKPVPAPGNLRILAAEDDEISRIVLSSFLEKSGYRFLAVEDGEQAVAELEKNPYDVFLLDIKMPGISGIEVARLVREREAQENTRPRLLVAITANVMPADIQQIRAAGFDAVLAKPLNFTELVATLNQAANASPEGAALDAE